MTKIKLFPPFLNEGSNGGAVRSLQQHLLSLGYAVEGLSVSGNYRDKTGNSVGNMQDQLGVPRDRNCGPLTRAELKAQRGVDLDAILWCPSDGLTVWLGEGADSDSCGSVWPPPPERQEQMTSGPEGPPVTGA